MKPSEPLRLIEDETGGRFLLYTDSRGIQLDIRFEGETLWMTQSQMSTLFGRDQSVISRHITSVFEEGELDDESNMHKMHIASSAKPVTLYSLDMVISVGYRVSSKQGTLFRRWATEKLVQFATKGFVVDAERIKWPENADRVSELREIIRDIRADESNVYRELRGICAMCQDYNPKSTVSKDFYMQTQAKLLWAVTSQTPAEIVYKRVDSEAENMGLTNWKNENIRKTDISTSKSYLAEPEIRELNRLTTILLDIFEDQLELGKLTLMSEATELLEKQLRNLNRPILNHGGRISHEAAKSRAEHEYEKYKERMTLERHKQADETIAALKKQAKKLPASRKRKPN
jgi:hypothetical protein